MAITDTLIGNVKGKKGDAGEITSVTASVANNVGTPSCNVTLGGTPSERTINLAFSGLKGEKGDTGSTTTTGSTGDFNVAGDLSVDGELTLDNRKPFVEYFKVVAHTTTGGTVTSSINDPYNTILNALSRGVFPVIEMEDDQASQPYKYYLTLVHRGQSTMTFSASIYKSYAPLEFYDLTLYYNNRWELYARIFDGEII